MAFKHSITGRSKYALTALIDTVFLLLIFFLITSYVGTGVITEQNLLVPTPLQREGEMNVLIQLYQTNKQKLRAYYIDHTINKKFADIADGSDGRFPITNDINVWTENLFKVIELDYDISLNQVKNKLQQLHSSRTPIFIAIRCPFDVPYFEVIELTSDVPAESKYGWPIRYGYIEGDKESLFGAKIKPEYEGKRVKSLLIDVQD